MKNFIKKYWVLFSAVIIIPTIAVLSMDNNKISSSLDGAVVTDKTGKSYILQERTFGTSYRAYEFDMQRMKLIR